MKYKSLTTPDVEHDEANILAEFMYLNKNIRPEIYPWRGQNSKEWGKNVSALKKLMNDAYGLSAEQLAFYIWKCKPQKINPSEFAKMAVVARRLFHRYDIDNVAILYKDKSRECSKSGLENTVYKKDRPKSLLTFLRELERNEAK